MLARGDDGAALAGVPGDRIGFLQVADAPLLDMNVLEWSRHFRCFPGQGTLDVTGVVAADAGGGLPAARCRWRSSATWCARPTRTTPRGTRCGPCCSSRTSWRSAGPGPAAGLVTAGPAARVPRTDAAFVEIARAARRRPMPRSSPGSGFAVGRYRTAASRSPGGATARRTSSSTSPQPRQRRAPRPLGVAAPPVDAVAARAKALLWPAVDRTRGSGEALLPGITSPSGLHVFVSASARGGRRLAARLRAGRRTPPATGLAGHRPRRDRRTPRAAERGDGLLPHASSTCGPAAVEEFMEPHGRLRSRALRPAAGDLRVVLNVEDVRRDRPRRTGVTQVALPLRRRGRRGAGAARARGAADAGARQLLRRPRRAVRPGARRARRAARAPAALRPRRATASCCTPTRRCWRPGSTSSCWSAAAGTTATAPPARTCGWRRRRLRGWLIHRPTGDPALVSRGNAPERQEPPSPVIRSAPRQCTCAEVLVLAMTLGLHLEGRVPDLEVLDRARAQPVEDAPRPRARRGRRR